MRSKSARLRELSGIVFLGLATATWGFAQGTASLTGTVYDPTKAVIPDVNVTATHVATNVSYNTATTGAGLYRFPALPVGAYFITLKLSGFKAVRIDNVVLTVAQIVTQDITLEVGAVTETVTVEGGGVQLVQTDRAEVSALVDRATLASLPLEIRDTTAFVNLLPGAVPSALGNYEFNGSTRGSAVNGARGGTGNFILEGFDNNDQGQGGRSHNSVGSIPGAITGVSPDAIQEFRVVTNNFSAQYGRQAGFVADAVMKSGSNDVHGSVFEYNRNHSVTANDFFTNRRGGEDSLVRNQFGGSLGGPLRKDKTFIFGTVEIQKLRQSAPNVVTSVTPDFINFVDSGAFADFMETDPNGMCNNPAWLDYTFGDGSPGSGGPPSPCPGLLPNSRTLAPIARQLLQKYPMPAPTSNFTHTSGGFWFGGFDYPVPLFGDVDIQNRTTFNENRFNIKIDHNFGDNDRLAGLLAFDDFDTVDSTIGGDTTGVPGFPITALSRAQNWGLTYTHIFSPTVVNEAKISFLRHNGEFPRDIDPTVPSIVTAFDALTVGWGLTSSLPQNFTDNQFQYQDHLAITRGRHSIKTGFEYRRTRNGSVFAANRDGLFLPYDTEDLLTDGWFGSDFDNGVFGGDTYGGFYDAEASVNPQTGQKPEYYRGFRANEFGVYVQDDWKVHNRVTLNLGLRWDYYGPPHNFRPGFDSNFYFGEANLPLTPPSSATRAPNPFFPTDSEAYAREATATFQLRDNEIWAKDKNNFAPRFGLAWDVGGNQKTVIRLGTGVYYDRFWNNLFENIRFNPPLFSFNTLGALINGVPVSPTGTPGLYAIPIDTALFNSPAFQAVPSPRHMNEKMVAPYMEQVFFGIQRQVGTNMVVEANYIATFGHKLTGVVDLNTFAGRSLPSSVRDPGSGLRYSSVRPNPTIGRDNARGNFYNSNYHSLQLQLTKRMSHGLQFQSNYTYSKTLDYVSDAFNNRASGGAGIRPVDPQNLALEYGRADYDLRQRFVTSVIYDLPMWKQNRWAGGWTIGSIVTLQTGLPFTVRNEGIDYNYDGNFNDRPDYMGTGNPNELAFDRSISPADDGYLLTDDFVRPILDPSVNLGLWRNGRLGRNILTNPGLAVVDFSLKKRFRFTEKAGLQVEFNMFNIFNRVNFGIVDGNMNSGQFGRSTNTFGPRVGQIAARIDF